MFTRGITDFKLHVWLSICIYMSVFLYMESKLFVYILVYGQWIKCGMYVHSKIILYIIE
jgi:hypothetical protein